MPLGAWSFRGGWHSVGTGWVGAVDRGQGLGVAWGRMEWPGLPGEMFFCGSWLTCDGGLSVYISVIWVTADIGSALTAGHFGKEPVRTGDMVDGCAGTWWTLFGEPTSPGSHHALEHERCHEPERRVCCPSTAARQ